MLELFRLPVENPAFGKLPASEQLRYLMAARLDLPGDELQSMIRS